MTYAIPSARYPYGPWITLILVFLCATGVHAGDWTITPRLTLGEIYSDNIYLDNDDKEGDLITEITPGINISGRSARLEAELDYQMQGLMFLSNSDASSINQQLDAKATAEITKKNRLNYAIVIDHLNIDEQSRFNFF